MNKSWLVFFILFGLVVVCMAAKGRATGTNPGQLREGLVASSIILTGMEAIGWPW
jgi:hypothetical protein